MSNNPVYPCLALWLALLGMCMGIASCVTASWLWYEEDIQYPASPDNSSTTPVATTINCGLWHFCITKENDDAVCVLMEIFQFAASGWLWAVRLCSILATITALFVLLLSVCYLGKSMDKMACITFVTSGVVIAILQALAFGLYFQEMTVALKGKDVKMGYSSIFSLIFGFTGLLTAADGVVRLCRIQMKRVKSEQRYKGHQT